MNALHIAGFVLVGFAVGAGVVSTHWCWHEKWRRAREQQDAMRYRWMRRTVCGVREPNGEARFSIAAPKPLRFANIMRGSVAQHFDEAVDAELATRLGQP